MATKGKQRRPARELDTIRSEIRAGAGEPGLPAETHDQAEDGDA